MPDRTPFDVVHVVYYPFPADPRVRRYVLAAREAGLRVAVVALATGRDAPGTSDWEGVHLVRLAGSKRRGTVMQYVVEYGSFVRAARRAILADDRLLHARIVHVHSLPDFLVAAARPARARGARVILDLHEIFPEFTRSKFPGVGGRLAGAVAGRIERWSRRQAHETVSVNRPIGTLLEGRRAYPGERVTIVHNGPDPGDFGPARAPTAGPGGAVRLVYHGTLTPLYGLDLAVRAVALARAGGVDATLDIFGDGPQRAQLAALVQREDLGRVVRLHDPVPAAVLRERLPTFDGGLVPTRQDEMTEFSLSTKLLEYVHLGIPVLAPTLRTYLEYFPGQTLWYYRPNDATSMAAAIARFAQSEPAARVRGARAAQGALADLRWEREKLKILEIYRRLLAEPAPASRAA